MPRGQRLKHNEGTRPQPTKHPARSSLILARMTYQGSPDDDRLQKPVAVLDLAKPVADAFLILKARFGIGDTFPINLARINIEPDDFANDRAIAALTMRRLQSLWLLAQPENVTRSSTLIGLIQQTSSQFGLLQQRCDDQERLIIERATTALDSAFEEVTDLLARHDDALAGKLDVELGPTSVPNDPRAIRHFWRRRS